MTRCCVCGRFMGDDAVLLGYSRDLPEGGQEYAHYACVPLDDQEYKRAKEMGEVKE